MRQFHQKPKITIAIYPLGNWAKHGSKSTLPKSNNALQRYSDKQNRVCRNFYCNSTGNVLDNMDLLSRPVISRGSTDFTEPVDFYEA